jgi:hypothetical protein
MKRFFLFAIAINFAAPCQGQQSGGILWAKGGIPTSFFTTISASHSLKCVCTTSFEGDWQSWPLDRNMLGLWNSSGPSASCGVLVRGDSELIVGGSQGINAWEIASNQIVNITPLDSSFVLFLDGTADGNLIAAFTENDNVLHLYNRSTGMDLATWQNASGPVCFSPNGKLLLAAMNHSLVLIDVATQSIIHSYTQIINTPGGIQFDPSSNSTMFAVSPGYGIELMDTSGAVITQWPNAAFDFSPDGSQVLFASLGIVDILNRQSGALTEFPAQDAGLVTWMSEDTLVISNGSNVALYSIATQSSVATLSGDEGSINGLVYSKDGSKLFDGFNLWAAETGNLLLTNPKGPGTTNFVASSNLNEFVSAIGDGTVWIYSNISDSGHLVSASGTPNVDTSFARGIALFSPTDSVFVAGGDITSFSTGYDTLDSRNALRLWSADGTLIRQFDAPLYPAHSLSFSHDGSMLVGFVDETCYLWNVSTGQQIKTLGNNIPWMEAGVVNVAFLPGDTSVVFGCDSRTGEFAIDRIRDDSSYFVPTPVDYMDGTISVLPDGLHFAEIDNRDPMRLDIFDLTNGTLDTLNASNGEDFRTFVANPITGGIATGGQSGSLIAWNSLFALDAVKESSPLSSAPLEAFAGNGRITVRIPLTTYAGHSGKVFVYRSDGQCYFISEVPAGESTVTTSVLPSGDYFIVLEPSNGGQFFTKVSLFQ